MFDAARLCAWYERCGRCGWWDVECEYAGVCGIEPAGVAIVEECADNDVAFVYHVYACICVSPGCGIIGVDWYYAFDDTIFDTNKAYASVGCAWYGGDCVHDVSPV